MVEDCAIERLSRSGEFTYDAEIAVAGPRVSAWVVVGEPNSAAAEVGCVGDNLTNGEIRAGFVTWVIRQVETMRVVVDMGDPQALPARVIFRQAACKELFGDRQAVELKREFGTLIPL